MIDLAVVDFVIEVVFIVFVAVLAIIKLLYTIFGKMY